ncbi:MAG: PilT/PilU family type 4a pilus ATPase [Deltaproteobacteria bacterium]|nr:PilT/PilU family type 4a pilus ATPase [Deltaproteobacteria bacterium]
MARLDSFLRLVVEQKASDLHFMAGNKPLIRHDGELVPIPFRQLTDTEARRFLMEILTEEQRDILEREQEVDFAYDLRGVGRFRANVFHQSRGIGSVFRVIPEEVPELDDLDLPSAVNQILDLPNGLVLFCGPTGCGKSTTQAALINELNKTRPLHIITIEDPIEFLHPHRTALMTQRQIGEHVASFGTALKSALRESPDVVLVGEMRDLETMKLALSAAETGVLVFGTLHTGSAAKAVDRIVDAFPEGQGDQVRAVLSVIVRAVVSQRLVRNATEDGRTAAIELLFVTTGVANMIRENKAYQIDAMLQSVDPASGMQSLDTHLLRLVRTGQVDAAEALKHAVYPAKFREILDAEDIVRGPSSA